MPSAGKKFRYLWLLLLLVFVYYQTSVRTGLPSDEEMIEHYKANQADFEELVRRFRSFEAEAQKRSHHLWAEQGDTPEIMKRAKIKYVSRMGQGNLWLPNPYAIETAKKINVRPREPDIFTKYGGLSITPVSKGKRDDYYSFKIRYGIISKDYVYFPQVPRVEDGYLLWPVKENGEFSLKRGVADSLNFISSHWKSRECIYRRINENWFLCMCRTR